MYRIAVAVFVFVALVCFGAGPSVHAQTEPPIPVCPDFSGTWTFWQQRIDYCAEGEPREGIGNPYRRGATGTYVITQITNPPDHVNNSCLFTAVKTTTWANGNDVYEVGYFTGSLMGDTLAMQGVAKPLGTDNYINPPAVVFAKVAKRDKRTKAPIEIHYQFNANTGEIYSTSPYHCASTGDGVMYKNR